MFETIRSRFFHDCVEMHIGLWECPSFLFLMLGIINLTSIAGTYFITSGYEVEPELVALISVVVAGIFLVISYVIVQAFGKAAEANRVKSEFVGIASHQLRTPLTNIKFALEYLASPKYGGELKLNEKQSSQLTIIRESNDRLLKLVSNLLDLSRIEQGSLVLEREPIDLASMTDSILQELQPLINAKNLKVHYKDGGPFPRVSGDNSRVRMVVQNLIDNAIKYNKEGGDLWVTTENQKNYLFWSVADTGLGIPKTEQRRVFQKFFRSPNAVSSHSYGSGLGLFIVKGIITELGGDIGFTSKEGGGTTFWFKLPVWQKNE